MDMGFSKDFFADRCFKLKFRWLMYVPEVSSEGINSLPPLSSARPTFSFREKEIKHISEIVKHLERVEYDPLDLILYDTSNGINPVYQWIKSTYNPFNGHWAAPNSNVKKEVRLKLFDGCGNTKETWVYEGCHISRASFDTLDMANDSDVIKIELKMSFDRAYLDDQSNSGIRRS